MRLRVNDDGRWAVDNGVGSWMLLREGVYEPHAAAELHEPGWHEAIVLPLTDVDAVVLTATDADAQRLGRALAAEGMGGHTSYYAARALNRLTAGTEGEQ